MNKATVRLVSFDDSLFNKLKKLEAKLVKKGLSEDRGDKMDIIVQFLLDYYQKNENKEKNNKA